MTDNRNTILAVILSGLVLIAWQYFYNVPQMERQRALQQTQAELAKPSPQATPGSTTPQAEHANAVGQCACGKSACLRGDCCWARYRHRRHAPHQDQHSPPERQHFPEGCADRRPGADPVP